VIYSAIIDSLPLISVLIILDLMIKKYKKELSYTAFWLKESCCILPGSSFLNFSEKMYFQYELITFKSAYR